MIPNLNCNGYNGNERKENFDITEFGALTPDNGKGNNPLRE